LGQEEADRVPLDLWRTGTTGLNGDNVYVLRQASRLDPPGTPVENILALYETAREFRNYPLL
jgi:hypothetical protein